MKNLPVGKVPYGTTFKVFDDEFIALDYQDGAVLAIRKEIWRKAPFDEGGKNDLRTASINKHLAEYEDTLIKAGAQGSLRARNFDLKATDGTREYGYLAGVCVALLTLEQYGKYQHLIPDVDGWWWLATPVWTPAQKGGDASCAWLVLTNGGCNYYGCAGAYGIRPALYFSSSLLVSIPDDEDAAPAVDESALFQEYLDYIDAWPEEAEPGTSPMTFEEWKESMKKDGD